VVIPALNAIKNKGIKISVICYIRRHDSWARSAYLQWGIKHKTERGKVKSFSEWIPKKINFSNALYKWTEFASENCYIQNFDKVDNLISDFFKCADVPMKNILEKREYETPGNVALNLWALYNSQFEKPVLPNDLYPLFNQSGLMNKSYCSVDLKSIFPTPLELNQVLKDSENDINAVNDIFEKHSQPKFSQEELSVKNYSVDTNELISGLLDVIKFQNNKLNDLESRIIRLEEKK
jgi:hypothetical protein